MSVTISNGRPENKEETARLRLLYKQQDEADKKAAAEGRVPPVIDSSFAVLKQQGA